MFVNSAFSPRSSASAHPSKRNGLAPRFLMDAECMYLRVFLARTSILAGLWHYIGCEFLWKAFPSDITLRWHESCSVFYRVQSLVQLPSPSLRSRDTFCIFTCLLMNGLRKHDEFPVALHALVHHLYVLYAPKSLTVVRVFFRLLVLCTKRPALV